MKAARKLVRSESTLVASANRARGKNPASYIFCDKKTGATKFTVDADTNGEAPVDRIAGSLAVYCVAHYCSPKDLVLVIRADESLSAHRRTCGRFASECSCWGRGCGAQSA